MPSSSGDKLCPICDSPLQPGSKKCSFCGTDLSIFDIDIEPPKKVPEPVQPPPKPSFESRVEEVLSKPYVPPTSILRKVPEPEQVKPTPMPAPPSAGIRKIPEVRPLVEEKPAPPVAPVPSVPAEVAEYFECPECGATVEAAASSCPKCGVIYAEEGAEMFQCPACNTLVNVDAESCPGCGAVFVESEEEAAVSTELAPKKDIEPPLAEIKPEKPKVVREVKPEAEVAGAPERKVGFGRWFRRKKEEEPEVKAGKPSIREVSAPVPSKPPEPKVREVRIERPAEAVPAGPPPSKDKGRDLARMVAEMKPLLALAREKDVEIGESKQLIDEAAVAGRERQLDKAIEFVDKSKRLLMVKIDSQLAKEINRLNEEIKVAKDFGGDISRAATYVQEVARARASGDVEAAYVYVDKVSKELLPITGRYNESKAKIASLKLLIADCEVFIVDTKEARGLLVDATRAFDARDFDKTESLIKSASDKLYKAIPVRMNDEMRKAKDQLLEAKMKNVNITPMLTVLKSATSLMKSGDYAQALKEMREFREMIKKAA